MATDLCKELMNEGSVCFEQVGVQVALDSEEQDLFYMLVCFPSNRLESHSNWEWEQREGLWCVLPRGHETIKLSDV